MKDRKVANVHFGDPGEMERRDYLQGAGCVLWDSQEEEPASEVCFPEVFIFWGGVSRSRQFGLVPLLDLRLFNV